MLYLIQQIVLCLLFTALIGVAVGWLLRGMGSSRQSDMVAAEWRAKVAHIESRQETAASATATPAATAPRDEQYDALRQRLADRERELATLRTARAVRTQTDDDSAREELRETRIICQQLQGRMAEQRTLNEQLEKRVQLAAAERTTLVERLRDLETRHAQQTQERQHAIDTIAGLQKQLRARTAASQKVTVTPAPQPAQPKDGSHDTAARTALALQTAGKAAAGQGHQTASQEKSDGLHRPVPPPAKAPGEAAPQTRVRQENGPGQQSLPIADTSSPQAAPKAYEPTWRLTAPEGAPDSLQAVYGIGPKIEQRLNELGIFHFRQIAAFEKPDILWLARHLQSFPGRILRDRWVEQARSLEKRRRAGQPI